MYNDNYTTTTNTTTNNNNNENNIGLLIWCLTPVSKCCYQSIKDCLFNLFSKAFDLFGFECA